MSNEITQYVNKKMPAAWSLKSKSLNIDMETYAKRAIMTIYDNKQLLQIANSEIGMSKIMMRITDAAMMGLQFGGQFPQVYIVGFVGKDGPEVTLIPTAEGYRHMATQGKDPILKEFTVRPVYEGEDFNLNYTTGEVQHSYNGKIDKGDIIGIYGVITDANGVKRAEFMTKKEIEKIRDTHSKYYINFKKGPWVDDFEAMCIKTAAKKFLKPYAALKEGREIALAMEEEIQNPNIETRMEDHLDNIIDIEPEPETNTESEQEVQEENTLPEPPPSPPKRESKADLF